MLTIAYFRVCLTYSTFSFAHPIGHFHNYPRKTLHSRVGDIAILTGGFTYDLPTAALESDTAKDKAMI